MSSGDHWRNLERMYLSAPINQQVYSDVEIKIEAGKSTITHRATAIFFHAGQRLHGSVYFKMLDDAAYFAVSSLIEDEFIYTVNFQIQILRPVSEGALRAEGWIEKAGKTISIAHSYLYDERNRRVAIGQGQFMKSGIPLDQTKGYNI